MAYTNKKSAKRKHRQKRRTKKVGGVITYKVHTRALPASNKAAKEEKEAEKAAQQAEKAAEKAEKAAQKAEKAAEKAAQKAEKAAQKAEKTRLVNVKVADEVSSAALDQAFFSMFDEPYNATSKKPRNRKLNTY